MTHKTESPVLPGRFIFAQILVIVLQRQKLSTSLTYLY
jgi:hypothetical protein